MAKDRHSQIEAQSLSVLPEVFRQPFGIVFSAFGHHDNRVRFAAILSPAQRSGDRFRVRFDFRNYNRY